MSVWRVEDGSIVLLLLFLIFINIVGGESLKWNLIKKNILLGSRLLLCLSNARR